MTMWRLNPSPGMAMESKTYLSDGVYANFDGYHLWTTNDHGREVVVRSTKVWNKLKRFAEGLNL